MEFIPFGLLFTASKGDRHRQPGTVQRRQTGLQRRLRSLLLGVITAAGHPETIAGRRVICLLRRGSQAVPCLLVPAVELSPIQRE